MMHSLSQRKQNSFVKIHDNKRNSIEFLKIEMFLGLFKAHQEQKVKLNYSNCFQMLHLFHRKQLNLIGFHNMSNDPKII